MISGRRVVSKYKTRECGHGLITGEARAVGVSGKQDSQSLQSHVETDLWEGTLEGMSGTQIQRWGGEMRRLRSRARLMLSE